MEEETGQVELAVPALLAYVKKKKEEDKRLFDDNQAVWMVLSLKKIPAPEKKPRKIPLPYTLNEDAEVCLFSKLPGKKVEEQFKAKGITRVSKVISLTKLRKNYKTYELKRRLCSQYDVFLCDDRIYHLLPKVLGKAFFSRKKEPTPISMIKGDLGKKVDRSLSCTQLRLGHGPCSAIKIGHTGQTESEITQNIMHAASVIAKKIPRGWNNIQSLHLKTSDSVALPMYNSLPDIDITVIEEAEPPKKKQKV